MTRQTKLGNLLIVTGAITIAIGLILAAVVGEPLVLIAVAIGLSDVGLGILFRAGKLPSSGSTDVVDPTVAEDNPYARED